MQEQIDVILERNVFADTETEGNISASISGEDFVSFIKLVAELNSIEERNVESADLRRSISDYISRKGIPNSIESRCSPYVWAEVFVNGNFMNYNQGCTYASSSGSASSYQCVEAYSGTTYYGGNDCFDNDCGSNLSARAWAARGSCGASVR